MKFPIRKEPELQFLPAPEGFKGVYVYKDEIKTLPIVATAITPAEGDGEWNLVAQYLLVNGMRVSEIVDGKGNVFSLFAHPLGLSMEKFAAERGLTYVE